MLTKVQGGVLALSLFLKNHKFNYTSIIKYFQLNIISKSAQLHTEKNLLEKFIVSRGNCWSDLTTLKIAI